MDKEIATVHLFSPKTILDLPVELLQRIFGYLTDVEVYVNVRCVCWGLRTCVEDYVQIGKKIKIK